MSDLSGRLRILALDFDGVIHNRPRSPYGDAVIDGPVVPGAVDFIMAATQFFEVHVYSCRSASAEGIEAMKAWLYQRMVDEHRYDGAEVFTLLHWPTQKPPAFVSLDDRGIQFTGTFPNPAKLLKFRAWNRQGPVRDRITPAIYWGRR